MCVTKQLPPACTPALLDPVAFGVMPQSVVTGTATGYPLRWAVPRFNWTLLAYAGAVACCAVIPGLCCLLQLLLRLQRVETLVNQQQQAASGKPGVWNILLGLAKGSSPLFLPYSFLRSSS